MLHRYFVRLSYRGTAYSGWQFQPGLRTIQQTVDEGFSKLLKEEIRVVGCGRTDAGVHAKNYYAHFDSAQDDLHVRDRMVFLLNKVLPADISVHAVYRMPENAHARFAARSRSYEYIISKGKDCFGEDLSWELYDDLDLGKMNQAAALITGEKDFYAFSKTPDQSNTTICRVSESLWKKEQDRYVYRISSNRFLRNMVRSLVGHFTDIGKGKLSVEKFGEILSSRQSSWPTVPVPAEGLFLTDILYSPELEELLRGTK